MDWWFKMASSMGYGSLSCKVNEYFWMARQITAHSVVEMSGEKQSWSWAMAVQASSVLPGHLGAVSGPAAMPAEAGSGPMVYVGLLEAVEGVAGSIWVHQRCSRH